MPLAAHSPGAPAQGPYGAGGATRCAAAGGGFPGAPCPGAIHDAAGGIPLGKKHRRIFRSKSPCARNCLSPKALRRTPPTASPKEAVRNPPGSGSQESIWTSYRAAWKRYSHKNSRRRVPAAGEMPRLPGDEILGNPQTSLKLKLLMGNSVR